MTEALERRVCEGPGNVRLVGGEMLLWSDTGDVTGWGPVALELLDRLLPGAARVLLVGPHPVGLVDRVAARAGSVAAVLRSFPDACALGERHPDADVHCGRLDLLALDGPYDLVLALDGLARAHSAEAPAVPWGESLAALAGLVAPGGRLALGVRNDLGVDRLVDACPPDRDGGDSWEPHGFDPTYPGGPVSLDAALESAGLRVERCYAAYPDGRAPRAVLARELLAMGLPEALTFPLSARQGERMPAADPMRLTRLVFRHRLGEELAPLWLAVAAREEPEPVDLPLGLVEEGSSVHELVGDGTGRLVTRRLPAGAERPVPVGRVVEEALVEACAREDVRAVRVLLAALAQWVEDGGDVTAAADTLVWDGDSFHPLDPGPAPPSPPPAVVLCRMLWRFAVRLLAAGRHHPWPWPLESDQLALTLCDLAGRPCDLAELEAARAFDAELGPSAEPGDPAPTYRDLLRARDRLAGQLIAAQGRISRLERRLVSRERALARARARLRRRRHHASVYRRTLGYRLSRGLARPRRAARKVMRLLYG
ncbi:hypothetical protein ACQEUU_07865 [Nonomuraea sp. CA-218870]|uniref:hypothetical protein n=1 Tax=Nonomuraea sp. CA-218870 TaxID=3239998 RepID=UPI003D93052A